MTKRRGRQPINDLFELLGRRWTLRILWELRSGALTFRALRTAAGEVSPSVLNGRLSDLRSAGVVDLSDDGYVLTEAGRELGEMLLGLSDWARRNL